MGSRVFEGRTAPARPSDDGTVLSTFPTKGRFCAPPDPAKPPSSRTVTERPHPSLLGQNPASCRSQSSNAKRETAIEGRFMVSFAAAAAVRESRRVSSLEPRAPGRVAGAAALNLPRHPVRRRRTRHDRAHLLTPRGRPCMKPPRRLQSCGVFDDEDVASTFLAGRGDVRPCRGARARCRVHNLPRPRRPLRRSRSPAQEPDRRPAGGPDRCQSDLSGEIGRAHV